MLRWGNVSSLWGQALVTLGGEARARDPAPYVSLYVFPFNKHPSPAPVTCGPRLRASARGVQDGRLVVNRTNTAAAQFLSTL